jgi:hypothetical protein
MNTVKEVMAFTFEGVKTVQRTGSLHGVQSYVIPVDSIIHNLRKVAEGCFDFEYEKDGQRVWLRSDTNPTED